MVQFKYFNRPDLYTGFLEEEVACGICGNKTTCFDASLFYGEEKLKAICPDCLANGKLYDRDISTCDGDQEELKKQLKVSLPALSDADILQLVDQKTNELEKTTPSLITWQDFNWPCLDGDYCRFIGYGSKALYHKLAGTNGESLFADSIWNAEEMPDAVELWVELPDEAIRDYRESNRYSVLFYVFQSLYSERIITLWDCD